MQTTKQLQRFYVVEVFRLQPPIPGSQGSETVSLPYGTSAFDQRQYTKRVNRGRVEGTSPSTCARSRFPLHPSLPALDGVSIEGKDEHNSRKLYYAELQALIMGKGRSAWNRMTFWRRTPPANAAGRSAGRSVVSWRFGFFTAR